MWTPELTPTTVYSVEVSITFKHFLAQKSSRHDLFDCRSVKKARLRWRTNFDVPLDNYYLKVGLPSSTKSSSTGERDLFINPLCAKQSFQLWYPGGQRLKVISFSWSWVKSPSKCFSYAEPTTIIASRDEKRCNASVQWTRLVHSRSLPGSVINTGSVTDDCFSSLSPICSLTNVTVQPPTGKQRIAKR